MSNEWQEFVRSHFARGGEACAELPGCVGRFGALIEEYRAIRDAAAVVDRSERASLAVTGTDRATWLHNLTTNEVKNLQPGEGNYAFALNVKGRILFDLNIAIRDDAIWVDLDRRMLESALKHFEKYTIIEDVTVTDRTNEVGRFAVVGPKAPDLFAEIGASPINPMPSLGTQTVSWSGSELTLMRHDLCGAPGVEVMAGPQVAVALWSFLTSAERTSPAVPAGRDAVNVHRIEAGIPWLPYEINDEVLPAETCQLERAVSYHKGCYLGQEVVERMRSRGVVARNLCGVVIEADVVPEPGLELHNDAGQAVGTLASACRSFSAESVVGLGYLKTGSDTPGTRLTVVSGDTTLPAVTSALPFARSSGT